MSVACGDIVLMSRGWGEGLLGAVLACASADASKFDEPQFTQPIALLFLFRLVDADAEEADDVDADDIVAFLEKFAPWSLFDTYMQTVLSKVFTHDSFMLPIDMRDLRKAKLMTSAIREAEKGAAQVFVDGLKQNDHWPWLLGTRLPTEVRCSQHQIVAFFTKVNSEFNLGLPEVRLPLLCADLL